MPPPIGPDGIGMGRLPEPPGMLAPGPILAAISGFAPGGPPGGPRPGGMGGAAALSARAWSFVGNSARPLAIDSVESSTWR